MANSTPSLRVLRQAAWFVHLITCVLGSANSTRAAEATPAPDAPSTAGATGTGDAAPSPEKRSGVAPVSQGILLGGGLGGAIPGGDIADGVAFGDVVDAFMIGRLDAGYRFNDYFLLGLYVEGGTGVINTSDFLRVCDDEGVDCGAGLVRIGVQTRAYFPNLSRFQAWGGAGVGYEWFAFNAKAEEIDESVTLEAKGAERLRLTLGLDIWAKATAVAVLQVGYTLGKYSKVTYSDSYYGSVSLDGSAHHSVTISAAYNLAL